MSVNPFTLSSPLIILSLYNFTFFPLISHPCCTGPTLVLDPQPTRVVSWSRHCSSTCHPNTLTVSSTTIKSLFAHILVQIASQYFDLALVFSASRAACFLPHRPWDCVINLLQRATLLGHAFVRGARAMEVSKAQLQGLISRSTSPASTSFFFVENKEAGLRACIDYQRLNAVTVRHSHPLQLVPAKLQGASIYTKLDPGLHTTLCTFKQAMNRKQCLAQ